ncbi:MAG TPA: AMP-binding protein [Alphaproteobacteria bacterium]|jgi:acyl-CoA synthetase (AMP-forming)/AMP-acid ligase II
MYPIDNLYRGWRRRPDGVALEDGARGLTYAELVEHVESLAAALQERFPASQARIGICGYNTIEHVLAILAVYAAGHSWVALNPRNGKPELDAIIGSTRLDLIVADENCLGRFTLPGLPIVLGKTDGKRGDENIAALVAAHRGARPRRREPPLTAAQTIKFTGGSTGRPKGVVQSYRCVNTSIASYLHHFRFGAEDVNLCAAPVTHGSSHYLLPILSVGGRHVLLEQPKPASILDAIESEGVTTAFMPPTMIYAIMAEPSFGCRDLSSLAHLQYGAAPMPPDRIREARAKFGPCIEVIFGQTEAPMMITCMTAAEFADERNLASVGRATFLMDVAIMDDKNRILPPGEMGEIVCRGDLVMNGYLEMPEETAKTIVDGWLHTGDAGSIDERGYLFIKDRIRDMIISGGFNVYPTDVEAALVQHPAVHECIVFGVPDPKWGERVEAAIQLKPGARFDEGNIVAFLKERVGSVKTPKKIHVAESLPRSAVGKVLRREARRMFASES